MKAPPAANKAAAPTAPVLIGAQAPAVLLLAAMAAEAEEAPAAAPPPSMEVGVGMPEVKGMVETELAPAKATIVVVGLAVKVVALGLRTASMTWTTPLATRTSGMTTIALSTKTLPFMMVMVTLLPFKVGIVIPLMRSVL